MSNWTPPRALAALDFRLSAADIEAETERIATRLRAAHDAVAAVPPADASIANTALALDKAEAACEAAVANVTFPMYTHGDAAVRKASAAAAAALAKLDTELGMRKDVYAALRAARDNAAAPDELATRLLDKTLTDYERLGVALEGDASAEFKRIKDRLSEIGTAFQQALNEDTTSVSCTEAQLAGVPAAVVKGMARDDDGNVLVKMDYPESLPTLQYARDADTRRRVLRAYDTRCHDNVALMQEAVALRARAAALLGRRTHAEHVLAERMAKTPDAVAAFLDELQRKMRPKLDAELRGLLALKAAEQQQQQQQQQQSEAGAAAAGAAAAAAAASTANAATDDDAGVLRTWDRLYYARQYKEQQCGVEEDALRPYFEMSAVVEGTLALYAHLFHLRFTRLPSPPAEHAERARLYWHADVELVEVRDAGDADGGDREPLGYIYFDLHPRDGKYSHAAKFSLQGTQQHAADGARAAAVCALVCNFTKPSADTPSLLLHNEVVTFLHEFGHALHHVVSTSAYARFAGTRVQRDFVECPSQFLENFAFEPAVLRRFGIGRHHASGEQLGDDVVAKLKRAKHVTAGLHYTRQLFFAKFDQRIHSVVDGDDAAAAASVDVEQLWRSYWKEMTGIVDFDDTHGVSHFAHLLGGYDAQYYGYLWSEVFACDIFAAFADEPCDAAKGRRYRDEILAAGGTSDADVLLRRFLGREPNQEAFLRDIGVDQQ